MPKPACQVCGHPYHLDGFCRETWIEPDGWQMDCGCRNYYPVGGYGNG